MGAIAGDELEMQESGFHGGDAVGGGGGGRGKEERILVSVRLRPLNEKEIYNRDRCDWECVNDTTIAFKNSLPERSILPSAYTFDKVFGLDRTTRHVYQEGAKEVALSVVSGINSSIFAYGQTSSGKTYTMSGITEYSVADIYDYVQKHEEREFILKFSAMEIYNEAVRDLLGADSTPLRLLDDPERGTTVEKLTEETLRDWSHLKDLLAICEAQRQIGETSLNETSSRSHQILRLTIESSPRDFLCKENSSTLTATVNFVDLAGSERASQAMSAGTRLKEGCHINRSLLTLGTVIRKLSKGRTGHIPYRDSKLTRILQPSLGGNARTAIICTMSPAHSHVEQSRNTLLFASCAKEVATNAQVNVLMSDKALVKHLQRELARLENELRHPGSAIQSKTLIRDKDVQILKMESEIKDLILQRDLAQSRLEDLLHTIKEDRSTGQPDFGHFSPYHVSNASKDEDILSESSSISFQPPDFSAKRINTSQHSSNDNAISSASYIPSEKLPCQGSVATQVIVSSPTFIGLLQHDGEDITSDNPEEFEDLCKEVRCIEMDETSLTISSPPVAEEYDRFQPPCKNSNSFENHTFSPNLEEHSDSSNHDRRDIVCTLEEQLEYAKQTNESSPKERVCIPGQQLDHVRRIKEFSSRLFCDEPSPCMPMASDFSSSKSSVLSRSRSCRATFAQSPAPLWFPDEVQDERTPPSMTVKDFSGRPDGVCKRALALKYDAQQSPSSKQCMYSKVMASSDMGRDKKILTNSEGDIVGMEEMDQIQHQEKCDDDQTGDEKFNGGQAIKKPTKDAGVDPMLNSMGSPSTWAFEFEKQQQEIIELWHQCNVSLVHRTYFFLLFRGEPADSIYLEVELRRLTFLKGAFSEGDANRAKVGDGLVATPASSLKVIRREREMLCRRMKRKLSTGERESLYPKWGIALGSKNRRGQLSRLLWSKTDMNHVSQSASIVAKLIGISEAGVTYKEMFGLSFTVQAKAKATSIRSSGWKYGIPSLI